MGRSAGRWLGLALVMVGTACGEVSSEPKSLGETGGAIGAGGTTGGVASTTGGIIGTGGVTGTGGITGTGGESTATGGESAATGGAMATTGGADATGLCLEAPTPRLASGTILEIPFQLALHGTPILFADDNPLPGNGTLTPLDVRFYISEVALQRANADSLPVDVVTSSGTVSPYGVYFFNADDVTSTTLRVLAPAGEYTGVSFLLGLRDACNTRQPDQMHAPLSVTSQMTWPFASYLFLRYQARTVFPADGESPTDQESLFPSVIHMGGTLRPEPAPLVRVDGALSIPASGTRSQGMQVALDELFKGALADIDLTGVALPPGIEVERGERLRRSLPSLHVFSFQP